MCVEPPPVAGVSTGPTHDKTRTSCDNDNEVSTVGGRHHQMKAPQQQTTGWRGGWFVCASSPQPANGKQYTRSLPNRKKKLKTHVSAISVSDMPPSRPDCCCRPNLSPAAISLMHASYAASATALKPPNDLLPITTSAGSCSSSRQTSLVGGRFVFCYRRVWVLGLGGGGGLRQRTLGGSKVPPLYVHLLG